MALMTGQFEIDMYLKAAFITFFFTDVGYLKKKVPSGDLLVP